MSRAARRSARRARFAASTRSDPDPRRPPTKADATPSEAATPPLDAVSEVRPAPTPIDGRPAAPDRPAVTSIDVPPECDWPVVVPVPAIDAALAPAALPTDATPTPIVPSSVSVDALDARLLPLVRALASVARETGSATGRLERALDLLFTACSGGDPELPALVIDAWQCARHDKQVRLRLAWQHEQLRLALQDILAEGSVRGELRPGIDAAAVAGVMVDAAEGCLLQSVTESGAIGAAELSKTLLSLALRGA